MLKLLLSIKKAMTRLLELAVILLVTTLVLDVLWGVFSRYVLGAQSRWTEELATTLLIWVSLLGASVAYGSKSHLGVDYFTQKLDPRAKATMELIVNILVALFAVIALVIGGAELVRKTLVENQLSPSLGIRVGYIYLALPVSGFFITIFCVERIIEIAAGKAQPPAQMLEGN